MGMVLPFLLPNGTKLKRSLNNIEPACRQKGDEYRTPKFNSLFICQLVG